VSAVSDFYNTLCVWNLSTHGSVKSDAGFRGVFVLDILQLVTAQENAAKGKRAVNPLGEDAANRLRRLRQTVLGSTHSLHFPPCASRIELCLRHVLAGNSAA
jgi:hypothetical protein